MSGSLPHSRFFSCGLFRATAPKYIGHLPPTAPPVDTHSREYEVVRRRFALSARDDFLHHVHSFSRVSFDVRQRLEVHAYLSEALEDKRMVEVPAKTVHDMIHLAFVAGFHDFCLALYHAKRHQRAKANREGSGGAGSCDSAETTKGDYKDGSDAVTPSKKLATRFLVSPHVVDSAYASESVVELLRMASYCAHCAERDRAGGIHPEVMTVFSLFRCVWRAVCLSQHFLKGEVSGTHSAGGTSADALEAARAMLSEYILPFVQSHNTLAETDKADGRLNEGQLDAFLRAVQRTVRYDTSGDDGEMLFYFHCLRTGCIVVPTPPSPDASFHHEWTEDNPFSPHALEAFSAARMDAYGGVRESDAAASLGGSGSGIVSHVNDTELFYAALIDTCAAGRHVAAAIQYYEDARSCCLGLSEREAETSASGGKSAPAAAAAETSLPRPSKVMSEYVLYRLLAVLQRRRDNHSIVKLARRCLRELTNSKGDGQTASIGISVWSVFLISAGEIRAADVALEAFCYARNRVRKASPATNERRGYEYLLQTALNALSKCQLKNFEAEYLIPTQEAGMLHCSREFYFCCLLQDAHNSVNPAERAAGILSRLEEEGVSLGVPIVSRLLKLYLRCESPLLLPTYQQAVREHGLAKRAWLDELIVWADRRRYSLSQEERAFILAEVEKAERGQSRVSGADSGSDHGKGGGADITWMGGLRTQLALLEHDYKVEPREYFFKHGQPPSTEPTVMDSRMYFLLKRPQRVLQGINAVGDGNDRRVINVNKNRNKKSKNNEVLESRVLVLPPASSAVLGDPVRRSSLAHKAALAGISPLFLCPFNSLAANAVGEEVARHQRPQLSQTETQWQDEAVRLYLVAMLEGLQRSCNHIP